MQYVVELATETLMFLIPASYEPCSLVSVAPVYPLAWSALNASMPGTAARTLAWAADLFARVRKLRYDGIAMASRIPRMMITTRSSISVKPRSSVLIRCHRLVMSLLRLVTAVAPAYIGLRWLVPIPPNG